MKTVMKTDPDNLNLRAYTRGKFTERIEVGRKTQVFVSK